MQLVYNINHSFVTHQINKSI